MYRKSDMVLETKHLTKEFPAADGRTLVACKDVNLQFYKGTTLGLVGESGCGKSTFMRMLVSLEEPTSGEIIFEGEDITKLKGEPLRQHRQNIQMVFQDPSGSFNPKMRIGEIICEPLLNFGRIKKSDVRKTAEEFLEMVDLPADFVDRYPHNMSGGQRQRVAIARALALEPELIIMDEATSALDVSVQKTIIDLIVKLQKKKNVAIGFIAHDLGLIQSFANQIAVMYLGNIVEILPAEGIEKRAKHPYTKALLGAIFDLNMDFSKKIESIDSEIPSPLDAPSGCPFQNRCEFCEERCKQKMPALTKIADRHEIACYRCIDEMSQTK